MTRMSDIPRDLVEEILSRVPLTSLKSVRSTCKEWNFLFKSRMFIGFMMMDSKVCSLRFDFQGLRDDRDFLDPYIKQVTLRDQIKVSKVFHCEGLLLCAIKDNNSKLLLWNPSLGQTRLIRPRNNFSGLDRYALGYDNNNNNRNHKILRFIDDYLITVEKYVFAYQIYDFGSDSWRVLDVTPDWDIKPYQRGVSLKGNTYFFAQEKTREDDTKIEVFLLCFDFTTESFGPRLPLPFHSYVEETVTLSCVREEKLAVLYQRYLGMMEIWVTTKIEPSAVSWNLFLKVDMMPLTGFQFFVEAGSFFIDEEKRVAVVFDLDGHTRTQTCRYQTAHIIGQDGYFKSVNIGEAPKLGEPNSYCLPLVCSSYVPSPVQII